MQQMKRRGELAEAMFTQRALAQGLTVAKLYGDSEHYDQVVGNGSRFWRMQVKSTFVRPPSGVYQVGVGRQTGFGPSRHLIPYSASEIDAFAIVLVPEDSVYIVPVEVVDGRVGLSFHGRNHPGFGRWLPYFEAWDLLRQTGEKLLLPPDEPTVMSARRQEGMGRRRKE